MALIKSKQKDYTPFKLNITDAVKFGEENAICVEVDNTHIDEMLPHQ